MATFPTIPSTGRVQIWRKMRTAGAVSLQHGVWLLPRTGAHEHFARRCLVDVRRSGGTGYVFLVEPATAGSGTRGMRSTGGAAGEERSQDTEPGRAGAAIASPAPGVTS